MFYNVDPFANLNSFGTGYEVFTSTVGPDGKVYTFLHISNNSNYIFISSASNPDNYASVEYNVPSGDPLIAQKVVSAAVSPVDGFVKFVGQWNNAVFLCTLRINNLVSCQTYNSAGYPNSLFFLYYTFIFDSKY